MANTTKKKTTSQRKPAVSAAKSGKKAARPAPARSGGTKQMQAQQAAALHTRRQIGSILLFAVSLLLFSMAIVPGQSIWNGIHNFLLGLFGFGAYLLPILMVYVSVISALEHQRSSILVKAAESVITILLICAAIHIFQNQPGTPLWQGIKEAYQAAPVHINGGAAGACFGGMLLTFGKTAACITVLVLLFVLFLLITGTTLIQFFKTLWKPVEKIEEHTQIRMEERSEKLRNRQRCNYDVDLGPAVPKGPFRDPVLDIPLEDPPVKQKRRRKGKDPAGELIQVFDAIPVPEEPEETETVPEAVPAVLDDIVKKAALPLEPEKREPELKKTEKVEFSVEESAMTASVSDYKFPPIGLLQNHSTGKNTDVSDELKTNAEKLVDTLQSFGVQTKITDICRGPTVTRYELKPSAGVKISKITGLADDIALNLAASGVRIEAPIPNKAAVGIEVPNKSKSAVGMRELIDAPQFVHASSKLTAALGKDITGNGIYTDLSKMPHLLIAGATGSGKSVCLNAIIVSILYKSKPEEVKFLMIDPKTVELAVYQGIPHLLVPVVTDPRKAAGALGWAVSEMLLRYKIFADQGVRDIGGYQKHRENNPELKPMPRIVIIIDELADLMMAAPNEVEDSICRLAQMARAAGMHLVIATQRPSVDVITGIIKANIPSRIALTVSSQVDSRTILDMGGAEKLLGKGDMLYNPVGASKPTRVQGCFLTDEEIEAVISFVKNQGRSDYDEEIIKEIDAKAVPEKKKGGALEEGEGDDTDELLSKAVEVVLEIGSASTSVLQRRLKVGYARGARIIDQLQEKGIVGPPEGSKPRKVLITKQQWLERCALTDEPTGSDGVPTLFDLSEEENDE